MNSSFLESRYSKIVVLIIILMAILGIRLFVLTVIQNDEWGAAAEKQSTETIYTSAARGDILDRNGKILATNKQTFAVNFNASGLSTEEINNSAYTLMNKLDENGDKYKDDFPIKIDEDGNFSYTFSEKINTWLTNQGLPTNTTAEQAFNKLREKYKIDPALDRYDALKSLQDDHNVNPPIAVKAMKYSYDEELEQFLKSFSFSDDEIKQGIDAKTCFHKLRENFKIDKNLSDTEARKIFIIRYKVNTLGYMKYKPIKISSDVSIKTVAYVEENSGILKGVEIGSETKREYPNGSLASHILGYMGSISDDKLDEYVNQKGYRLTDLIGKDGIEAACESSLKGKDGEKKVLVNASGEYINTISETDAEKGKNIYLTIDSDLQKKVESTLSMTVNAINGSGGFKSSYGAGSPELSGKCQSGSIVVLDVKSGEVLSLANYPDYNPNIFAGGITEKAWDSVQSNNPRDSLSPTPLVNMAATASIQPGSIFKPITAISALKAGLDPNRTIYDGMYIDIGNRKFGCDLYNNGGGSHGAQTLAQGLGNSCNYYFYCAGTGTDYNNNSSLGYELSNKDIMKTAEDFGLGSETGIELYESTAPLPSEGRKLQSTKVGLWTYIYNNSKSLFPTDIANDYEALHAQIDEIVSWLDDYPSRDEIATNLKEKTKVKEDQIEVLADDIKYSYVDYSKWTLGDSFNICIGQGDNAFTPLQMARYVAGIGNGGKLNKLNLIKSVEGSGLVEKPSATDTGVTADQLSYVLQGMHNVTTSGTLSSVFNSFSLNIPVAAKTGTAEKDGRIQPKDEVSYVKEHLSAWTSSVSWSDVESTMKKLMQDNPDSYKSENDAVDDALIQASEGKVTQENIDAYKDKYSDFAWTMALAPADKPEIAVVVLLVQGSKSYNAGLAAREVIGDYFSLPKNSDYTDYTNGTKLN